MPLQKQSKKKASKTMKTVTWQELHDMFMNIDSPTPDQWANYQNGNVHLNGVSYFAQI